MYHRNFAWADSWIEKLWVLGLLLAALVIFSINLGGLALRDWDEGTVAQVAREIASAPSGSLRWLHPTLAGEAYLNKPPLMHLLIAGAYKLGGVNEWTSRLPGAMLTALSVPLLYGIGREIFKSRLPAIFSAAIYLTLLPVVRHGRLAMLDGAVLCFSMLMIWCVLRSRRDLRWGIGVGIGFGLICLTKGIMGLLVGAIALLFLVWDTPRLLTSAYLWLGLLMGGAPAIAWYTVQWWHYGQNFINTGVWHQSLQRIWEPVENHSGPPWYYLLEILKYSWPWLLFYPQGWQLTWENRNCSWAKLILTWSVVYLVAISVMSTKLPWYVFPIYPAVALTGGVQLAEIWHNWPTNQFYTRFWVAVFSLLGVVAAVGVFYYGGTRGKLDGYVQLVLAAAGLTFLVAAFLIAQKDLQFIVILLWGTYVSLLLLMMSPDWIWELKEAYPVKPVAEMIQSYTPTKQVIYTSYPYGRPSLNFYSDRQVIPASLKELQQHWEQDEHPYVLLDDDALKKLDFQGLKLETKSGWTLYTKN